MLIVGQVVHCGAQSMLILFRCVLAFRLCGACDAERWCGAASLRATGGIPSAKVLIR